ncbi:hypothetical protein C2845_PM01G45060 [Panicum miliaceum]|uniref:Uncharacterized protein n=1 Tax=Panicum miliaceum TaxID=4540 RepID=A0A3L6TQJ7_PANMI|nr:hypothetical protein C2845_PM01G45060 [Panicum miliaceum]
MSSFQLQSPAIWASIHEATSTTDDPTRTSCFELSSQLVAKYINPRLRSCELSASTSFEARARANPGIILRVTEGRILVDNGSSADIITWRCFVQMGFIEEDLKKFMYPQIGFGGG